MRQKIFSGSLEEMFDRTLAPLSHLSSEEFYQRLADIRREGPRISRNSPREYRPDLPDWAISVDDPRYGRDGHPLRDMEKMYRYMMMYSAPPSRIIERIAELGSFPESPKEIPMRIGRSGIYTTTIVDEIPDINPRYRHDIVNPKIKSPKFEASHIRSYRPRK